MTTSALYVRSARSHSGPARHRASNPGPRAVTRTAAAAFLVTAAAGTLALSFLITVLTTPVHF